MKKIPLIICAVLLFSLAHADTIKESSDADFYAGSMSSLTVSGTGSGAYITLDSAQIPLPGNGYLITGASDYQLYTMSDRYSMAFSAPFHMTVTAIVVFGQFAGTTASYNMGLKADNGTGLAPVSEWLNASSYSQVSNALASGESYYIRVTMGADAYLNSGNVYHAYIEPVSGVDGSNYFMPRSTSLNNGFFATNGRTDTSQTILRSINSGATWTQSSGTQPVLVIEYLDPNGLFTVSGGRKVSYIGNPYRYYEHVSVYGGNYAGQEFTVPARTVISTVGAYLSASSSAPLPSDNLNIVIQDITDPFNVLLLADEQFVSKSEVIAVFSWYNKTLASPVTLSNGKKYRIFFKSPLSNFSANYMMRSGHIYRNPLQNNVMDESGIISSTYRGQDSYHVFTSGAGTSWDDYSKSKDLVFILTDTYSVMYATSGMYESKAYDIKTSAVFKGISWLPVTQTAAAGPESIRFQIAANNDASSWNFIGPDGTGSTWFSDPSGSALPGVLGNKRYAKFRMLMSTLDVSETPFLYEVSLDYDLRPYAPTDAGLTNYPNPFNPKDGPTAIRYTLSADTDVTVTILNAFMETVKVIEIASGSEGGKGVPGGYDNSVHWDGRNQNGMLVESGAYYCLVKIKDGNKLLKRKIGVIR